tara:strand:- start:250 stop:933 length:684 start_codon:yes stop_codon:yes gene_type:complete
LIFCGDSWLYSYTKSKIRGFTGRDIEHGRSIPELYGGDNICHAKRRANNAEILKQVADCNGACIVFQSDPLRDTFIDYNTKKKPTHLEFEEEFIPSGDFGLMDIVRDRLNIFYKKLSAYDVLLVSGASKVDVELAEKHKLKYIGCSVTEILIGTFDDTPLFDYHYTIKNHEYLSKTFPQYRSQDQNVVIDTVGMKNLIWKDYPKLFANRHATQHGNQIFVKYLTNKY